MTLCQVLPSLSSSLAWGGTYQFWHTQMDPLECTSASGIPDIWNKKVYFKNDFLHTYIHWLIHWLIPYSGKLSREKTFTNWWKMWFSRRKLWRLLAFAAPKDATLPNFGEKTFANSHTTVKFVKVFSLKTSRYTVFYVGSLIRTHLRPAILAQRGILISERKWSTQTITGTAVDPTLTPTTKVKS